MKKTRVVTREVEVVEVVDVLCNKCGGSCIPVASPPGGWGDRGPDLYGLIETTVGGGYFSSPSAGGLADCCEYTFSLCEKCLGTLFDSFVIPVQVFDRLAPIDEDEVDSEST